jgi:septum formation protein
MDIILGSGSPRRQEILRFFSLPFTQASPPFDERQVAFDGNPVAYVETLSKEKAKSLSPLYGDKAILTADTVVFQNGVIYNKPQDLSEAISFLKTLSGSWHSVFTSLSLFHKGSIKTLHEETKILFHELSLDQIEKYLEHVNFLDKAGGYAIQQGGSLIVKKIEGCYYNVMGLPLTSLRELLLSVDIDLWKHMKIL